MDVRRFFILGHAPQENELLDGRLLRPALEFLRIGLPFDRKVAALRRTDIIYPAARRIVAEENACSIGVFIKGKVSAVGGDYGHLINKFKDIHPNSGSYLISLLLRNPHIAVPFAAVAAAEALENWRFRIVNHRTHGIHREILTRNT